jgi:deoxyribodipyrimidine photolyase-related protein
MKKAGLLFPHQLFRKHPMFEEVDAVYLVEEDLFFKQYAF